VTAVSAPYRWTGVQEKVVAEVRGGAPQHTIIA